MKRRIAIQGIEGSFHHMATSAYFGENVQILPIDNFSDLVHTAKNPNLCEYALIAIENSIAGSILENYGLLQRSGLNVIGEIFINIKQNLLAIPGQSLEEIKEVYSHPMALQQCRKYLYNNLPSARLIESIDTSLSAKKIAKKQEKGKAAIASTLAAKLFNMEIIAENIEDLRNNQTRFFIISRREEYDPSFNRASIYFITSHKVGSLAKILKLIANNDINLSKLQSFPSNIENWQYYFHADLIFESPQQFNKAIQTIIPYTKDLRILGKYKAGKHIRM